MSCVSRTSDKDGLQIFTLTRVVLGKNDGGHAYHQEENGEKYLRSEKFNCLPFLLMNGVTNFYIMELHIRFPGMTFLFLRHLTTPRKHNDSAESRLRFRKATKRHGFNSVTIARFLIALETRT